MRYNNLFRFTIFNLLVCIACNGYSQWKYIGGPDSTQSGGQRPAITSLYVTNCEVFAGTEHGLFKSTDGCNTWTRSAAIDSNLNVVAIVKNGNVFVAGTAAGGIYCSDDDGTTWRKMNAFDSILCMAVNDSFVIAGNTQGLQRCRIEDSVWTWVDAGKIPCGIRSVAVKDSVVIAGGDEPGVYRSNDFGREWKAVTSSGLPSYPIATSLAISGEIIFALMPLNGLYFLENSGLSWTKITGVASTLYNDVVAFGNTVLIATGIGIYGTDFFGTTVFDSVNAGLENKGIRSFFLSGSSLYAGSERDGIWYRPVSDFNVPVNRPFDYQVVRQNDFKLQFSNNPDYHSVINFIIPESMRVKITLYDMAGHNICTPVNGYFKEGIHSIPLGNNSAHGFYIAKMNAGGSVLTAR